MAKSKTKLGFFGKIFLLFNYIFALILLLSYLAPFISPDTISFVAFLGLAYPYILVINLIFAALWIISAKKYFLISLIVVAIGWNNLGRHVQHNKSSVINDTIPSIKVVSFNAHIFDYYKWKDNETHALRNEFLEYIKDENPNIVSYQEFHKHKKDKDYSFYDSLINNQTNAKYIHEENYWSFVKMSLTTFSAYPIINKGVFVNEENEKVFCAFTDIKLNDDTIRVYNIHLESIYLSSEEYLFTENLDITDEEKNKKLKEDSKKLYSKLKAAFIKRAIQAETIAESIDDCPYPIIVCGDFNDSPGSYTYRTISRGLNDAFVESGKGMGKSYSGKFPSFRIDYILYSDYFESANFETSKIEISDHYPVSCVLVKRAE